MRRYQGVLFDLLSALLDSPSLWGWVAGDPSAARDWRRLAAQRMIASASYVPYEDLVAEAAEEAGLTAEHAERLFRRWGSLAAWDDVPPMLGALSVPFGVATNCSERLARQAVARLGQTPRVVVSAERANAYKPAPEPYRLAMRELAVPADAILYVAGSRYDAEGALRQGMTVFWVRRRDAAPLIGPRYVRRTLRDLSQLLGARHGSSA